MRAQKTLLEQEANIPSTEDETHQVALEAKARVNVMRAAIPAGGLDRRRFSEIHI
jgi:hypothetical protein